MSNKMHSCLATRLTVCIFPAFLSCLFFSSTSTILLGFSTHFFLTCVLSLPPSSRPKSPSAKHTSICRPSVVASPCQKRPLFSEPHETTHNPAKSQSPLGNDTFSQAKVAGRSCLSLSRDEEDTTASRPSRQ